MTPENTKVNTDGSFGLANAVVAALLATEGTPPAGTRGVIINFLKSSLVIGCKDLKHNTIYVYQQMKCLAELFYYTSVKYK